MEVEESNGGEEGYYNRQRRSKTLHDVVGILDNKGCNKSSQDLGEYSRPGPWCEIRKQMRDRGNTVRRSVR